MELKPSLERNTRDTSVAPGALPYVWLQRFAGCPKNTKFAAMIVASSCIALGGCAAKQMAEFTPGADALFRKFLTCQTELFQYLAANRRIYERYGVLKAVRTGGMWFDAKPIDPDSSAGVYRFEKPVKINGLTAVAVGYDSLKGNGKGYSGGDATYWGFYFAESPEDVFMALRDKYSAVAKMRISSGAYVNMSVLQPDGDKRYDQGSIIEADATQRGAKSYFNCSIQYVIPTK